MISMISALMPMASSVPSGPATGRKVVPGMTKAPQPMMHPSESAQTSSGDKYLASFFVCVSILRIPRLQFPVLFIQF